MRTQKNSGFTIIEVMLFLAITGALTVGLLAGAGVSINQQRYRDSVNSLKGLLQEQYGQVTNVINSEENNPICTQSGSSLVMDESDTQTRGTSDCLVIGRFVLIEPTKVVAYNLIGRPPVGPATETSDITVLGSYAMAVDVPESYEIGWGARVVQPRTTEDITTGVLIVRSPLSGSILTYTQDLPQATDLGDDERLLVLNAAIYDMISDSNTVQKDLCVDSGGASALAKRRAVRINARAANQSAIEIPLEEDNVCDQ